MEMVLGQSMGIHGSRIAQTSKIHLIRAIEHNDKLAKRAAHVFSGLSLASAGRSRGSTAHTHANGLW